MKAPSCCSGSVAINSSSAPGRGRLGPTQSSSAWRQRQGSACPPWGAPRDSPLLGTGRAGFNRQLLGTAQALLQPRSGGTQPWLFTCPADCVTPPQVHVPHSGGALVTCKQTWLYVNIFLKQEEKYFSWKCFGISSKQINIYIHTHIHIF